MHSQLAGDSELEMPSIAQVPKKEVKLDMMHRWLPGLGKYQITARADGAYEVEGQRVISDAKESAILSDDALCQVRKPYLPGVPVCADLCSLSSCARGS